mmetsp:Transcript_19918/g.76301  ORF Transcript_19918/g.76301 Transcript_19918/m.76301 type:complete len:429 (+) Transcript_19918:14-1300(+)
MAALQLTFTTEEQVVFELAVPPAAAVAQIKVMVEAAIGMPVAAQALYWEGRQLDDAASPAALGMRAHDLILVTAAAPGAPSPSPSVSHSASASAPASAPAFGSVPGGEAERAAAMRAAMAQFMAGAPSATAVAPAAAPAAAPADPREQMRAAMAQFLVGAGGRPPAPAGPRATAVRDQLLADPALLQRLLHSNPELATAVYNDDMPGLQRILDEQHAKKLEAERQHQLRIQRLNENPFDVEAQKEIEEYIRRQNVAANMEHALEHNPEAFARVVMLYVDCEVNGTPVKAFVDSGAQITTMSVQCARRCGIMRLVDTRYEGTVVGVGTSKVVGRVHIAPIKLGNHFYASSFTIVENEGLEFLLGLDMLRKHQCIIDLPANVLRIGDGEEAIPFLSEKDIPEHLRNKQPEQAGQVAPPPGPSAGQPGAST